jgi:16S rRNA A1518/A1519 N6-dimethyltransferase RsmA/KsgA/DIM1 with predicted DNA glycosylase/AP lyase activity
MAHSKKGTPAPAADKRTSYVLRSLDQERIEWLKERYEKATDMSVSEQDVIRFALRDACKLLGDAETPREGAAR